MTTISRNSKPRLSNFLQCLPFWGMAVVCVDDPNVRAILPRVTKPVMPYGFSEDARIRAINVRAETDADAVHRAAHQRRHHEIRCHAQPDRAPTMY